MLKRRSDDIHMLIQTQYKYRTTDNTPGMLRMRVAWIYSFETAFYRQSIWTIVVMTTVFGYHVNIMLRLLYMVYMYRILWVAPMLHCVFVYCCVSNFAMFLTTMLFLQRNSTDCTTIDSLYYIRTLIPDTNTSISSMVRTWHDLTWSNTITFELKMPSICALQLILTPNNTADLQCNIIYYTFVYRSRLRLSRNRP